ncbi:MAG: CBS domain-containing protein, partial [Proteobacteria bacterium]|nr:CBS domain-containing protein [Pseudomonadota bacterium]
LVTVRPEDYVFEAIYKMAKHSIHRLVVVDDVGCLQGILTDTDVIALQTRTPLYFSREVEAAESVDDLRKVNQNILHMVRFAMRARAGTKDIVKLISHFNDTITQRLIVLLERVEGVRLPEGSAYLVLGSEGRREQTLRTDQDSAAVYADDLSPAAVQEVARFSCRLVESLVEIGVPPCPGDTMASNPQWRRPLSEWLRALEQWISILKPEHMVNFGMFQDLRTVHGDPSLEARLKEHILDTVKRNSLFLPYVARNIVRFPPPLGWFGRIRVERSGEHKGTVNLKKAGIFAVTEGVSLMALEAGILDGSTWEKIEALAKKNAFPREELGRVDEAFTVLVQLRLTNQLRALAARESPTNYLDPKRITLAEAETLRGALTTVGSFLKSLRERYHLDYISR